MSLLIIGSCSRITSHIIQSIAKNKIYSQITLGDLLPTYNFHNRYYSLRKDLDAQNLKISVELQKLYQINQISLLSQSHSDVLFVTHDYFHTVTSKLKLMQLTANANKRKSNLYFATPVQYDHFGYKNPLERYNQMENKVRQINPNSTIIRSDVQSHGQCLAYINSDKNILDDRLFELSYSSKFSPRVVNTKDYAKTVSETMSNRVQGKKLILLGKQQVNAKQVEFDKLIGKQQICHIKQNVRNMVSKYSGLIESGYEQITLKS